MKRKKNKKPFWQSLFSMMILGVFMFFGIASLEDLGGSGPTTKHLGDGRIATTYNSNNGITRTYTGKQDKYGRWDGLVVIESNGWARREEVTYVDGMRHGKSKITSDKGHEFVYCYDHSYKVECEKAAQIITDNPTAFQIIKNKYPWFLVNLTYYGYEDDFVEAYLDTLEAALNTYEFEVNEFDDFYQNALDDVDGIIYDSIIYVNTLLSIFDGLELLKNSEFRMAIIDHYWSDETSTYKEVISTYPNYLHSINSAGIGNIEFESFCQTFDSLLATYGELNVQDPFFLDSMDNRMYRVMEYISTAEKSSSFAMLSLKSSALSNIKRNTGNIWSILNPTIKHLLLESSPKDVAAVVMSFMLFQFTEADIVRKAVREAYFIQDEIVDLPTATTEFLENNSSSSVSISSNIIEDGGAEISLKGIVWATYYNPTLNDQTINAGFGTEDFTTTIPELIIGQTYFARTFATNSAGTSYGNCISFKAGGTVGLSQNQVDDYDFQVYPNPASDLITIQFELSALEKMSIAIYNLNGQTVYQQEIGNLNLGENNAEINISGLKSGIYSCRLIGKDLTYKTRKIMIVR